MTPAEANAATSDIENQAAAAEATVHLRLAQGYLEEAAKRLGLAAEPTQYGTFVYAVTELAQAACDLIADHLRREERP